MYSLIFEGSVWWYCVARCQKHPWYPTERTRCWLFLETCFNLVIEYTERCYRGKSRAKPVLVIREPIEFACCIEKSFKQNLHQNFAHEEGSAGSGLFRFSMVKTKAIFQGCGKYAKSIQLSIMTRSSVIISPSSERMGSDVIPSAPGELFFFWEKMVEWRWLL